MTCVSADVGAIVLKGRWRRSNENAFWKDVEDDVRTLFELHVIGLWKCENEEFCERGFRLHFVRGVVAYRSLMA